MPNNFFFLSHLMTEKCAEVLWNLSQLYWFLWFCVRVFLLISSSWWQAEKLLRETEGMTFWQKALYRLVQKAHGLAFLGQWEGAPWDGLRQAPWAAGQPGGLKPGTSLWILGEGLWFWQPCGNHPGGASLGCAAQWSSLGGQHPGVSVPMAGGEWCRGYLTLPASNSQDDASTAYSHCSGLSFLKCLRWIQVCKAFPGVIL